MNHPLPDLIEYYPEKILKYCPKCGMYSFEKQSDNSLKCSNCGFRFYINSASAVAGLIINESGELLLTVRKYEPQKGMLDLPGGFVAPGEKAETALVREIKEELNLDVETFTFLATFPNTYLYGGIVYFTTDLCFICRVSDFKTIKAADDVAGFVFVKPNEIDFDQICFPSIKQMISEYLNSTKSK